MNKFAFSIFLFVFVLGFLGRILAGSIFCRLTFELKMICDCLVLLLLNMLN